MDGFPVLDWIWALPPITRTWFGLSLLVHAGTTLDFLPPRDLWFHHQWLQKGEFWRLFTSFLYDGGNLNEIHVILSLYMITMHSSSYERNPHFTGSNPRADYAFCLLVCMWITVGSYCGWEFLMKHYYDWYPNNNPRQRQLAMYYPPLFSRALIQAISYLWARRNPNANIQLNFIPVPGRYLPFAQMGLAYLMGNSIAALAHGVFVGHVYYYVVELVPRLFGKVVLQTPTIFTYLINELFQEQPEFRPDANFNHNHNNVRQAQARARNPQTPNNSNNNNNIARFRQEGATEAHIAAKSGNLNSLMRLAETPEGRQTLIAQDNNQWQPLHEAVRGGHLDVVNFLLSQHHDPQVDINARTNANAGASPLYLAESTLGPEHPVTRRLRELGAVSYRPEGQ